MSCLMCPDVPGTGWKSSGMTHCATCHTTWRMGTRIMHCVTCHETFTTPGNCDRHQRGTKRDPGWRCRPPATVGLVQDVRGLWHTPGKSTETFNSLSVGDVNAIRVPGSPNHWRNA